jgi:pimeloyl-ACP methyl ester carboxylesterase
MVLATSTLLMAGMAAAATQYLQRPQGRVAYETHGETGPWAVCIPGMGDVRAQFRFLVEPLVAAGHRVVLMDLRGLGESDATFQEHSAAATGQDLVALLDELDARDAVVLGNSMAAASAVWAAAERPQRVGRLVLLGPFVRDVPLPFYMPPLMDVLFNGPWGRAAWLAYYKSLYPTQKPADMDAYVDTLRTNLGERGRMDVMRAQLHATKARAEARIPEVTQPVLVVMGDRDPDFKDPRAEADLVAGLLKGRVHMVAGAGHYPHVEFAQDTARAIAAFLQEAPHATGRTGS